MLRLLSGLAAGFCVLCLFAAGVVLNEGVTLRTGGEIALPINPAQEHVPSRLTLVASLLGVATLGWLLARLTDPERKERDRTWGQWGCRALAELLTFLTVAGGLVGVLILVGMLRAEQRVAAEYQWLAAVSGGLAISGLAVRACAGKTARSQSRDSNSSSNGR